MRFPFLTAVAAAVAGWPLALFAQTGGQPELLHAAPLVYQSVLATYIAVKDGSVGDWRKLNAAVATDGAAVDAPAAPAKTSSPLVPPSAPDETSHGAHKMGEQAHGH